MKVRVIDCADGCGWVNSSACPHWTMDCPRARKKKKSHHKFKPRPAGYDVEVNGITSSDDLLPAIESGEITTEYLVEIDPSILDLNRKRYVGRWVPSGRDIMEGYYAPQGSQFRPAPYGILSDCVACGLTVAS